MIVLENLSKKIGTRVLFDDVSIAFNPGNRYGLTGANGAGKSTLLRMMIGDEDLTSGKIIAPNRLGFIRQDIEVFKDFVVRDVVIMGNARLWDACTSRDQLLSSCEDDNCFDGLAKAEEIILEEDGYNAESNAEKLLSGIGIIEDYWGKRLKELPTDIRFRVLICQALFGNPEALLLDEPTNYLDIDSIAWLENFTREFSGTVIIVSHDRHFLNSIVTHIADIDYESIILYQGNYDDMVDVKMKVRERADQESKSREKKLEKLKSFIAKFGAGSRASQVKSRANELKRLEPMELKRSNIQRPYIKFRNPEHTSSGKVVMKAEGLGKQFSGKWILRNVQHWFFCGDRVALVGANGVGKTTLLKLLVGGLSADEGTVELSSGITLGYFPQDRDTLFEPYSGDLAAFDWLKGRNLASEEQSIRSAMGKMLFSGDSGLKNLNALSGGEKARLILAELILMPYSFFIMDEPDAHLDLESVSALGVGLSEFRGAVIVASHNRDFIETFANKIIYIDGEEAILFRGSPEEFFEMRDRRILC